MLSVSSNTKAMGHLNNSIPQVPHKQINCEVLFFQNSSTVMTRREEILQVLRFPIKFLLYRVRWKYGKTEKSYSNSSFYTKNCQQKIQTCRLVCT